MGRFDRDLADTVKFTEPENLRTGAKTRDISVVQMHDLPTPEGWKAELISMVGYMPR